MDNQSAPRRSGTKESNRHQGLLECGAGKDVRRLLKNDAAQLPPPGPSSSCSSVKQVVNETDKIIRSGVQREFALHEKNKELKEANGIISRLQKNIFDLQMEHEQLDQHYQQEISYRAELVKRMDTTRNMVESAVQYANILDASVKQVEDDKLKIADFYNEIHMGQIEMEEKYNRILKIIKDKDDKAQKIVLLSESRSRDLSQAAELNNQLNRKLKSEVEKNRQLSVKLTESKGLVDELKASIESKVQEIQLNKTNLSKNSKEISTLKNMLEQHKEKEQEKFATLIKEKEDTVQKLASIENFYSDSLSENQKLKKENNKVKDEIDDLIYSNEELKKQTVECGEQLQKLKDENKELHLKCNQLEKEKQMYNTLNDQICVLTEEKEKCRLDIQTLENKLSDAINEKSKLKLEAERQEILFHELELKFESVNSEELNDKILQCENQLQMLQEQEKSIVLQLAEKETNIVELRLENQKLRTDTEGISKTNTILQQAVDAKEKEISNVNSEVAIKTAELQELSTQLKRLEEESVIGGTLSAKLRDNLEKEKAANETLKKNLQEMSNDKSAMKKELEKLKTLFLEMKNELDAISVKNANLEKYNQENDQIVIQYRNYLDEKDKLLNDYQVLNEKSGSKITELNEKVKDHDERNCTLKKQIVEKEDLIQVYQNMVRKLQDEIKEKVERRDEDVAKLKEELTDIKNIKGKEEEEYKQKLFSLQMETEKQKREAVDRNNEIQRLKLEIENLSRIATGNRQIGTINEIESKSNFRTPLSQKHPSGLATESSQHYPLTFKSDFNTTQPQQQQQPLEVVMGSSQSTAVLDHGSQRSRAAYDPQKWLERLPTRRWKQSSALPATGTPSVTKPSKKKDLFDFDSDSSVEHLMSNADLKHFKSAPKKRKQ